MSFRRYFKNLILIMCEEIINKHYIDLKYKNRKEEALVEISTLSKRIQFENTNNFSIRFSTTARIINDNLSLFKSACKHVDIVYTILDYLTNFTDDVLFNDEEEYSKEELVLSIILTIFNICREEKIQLFLENAIINDSTIWKIQYDRLKNELSNQFNEMILLDNSDLYAVMKYLMIIEQCHINIIWVHKSIKQKFLSFIKQYFHRKDLTIRLWTLIQDVIPRTPYKMNITSIWSEDIVFAKYLATILNRDVIFINTHLDLHSTVLLPWLKIFDKVPGLNKTFKPTINNLIEDSNRCKINPSRSLDLLSVKVYNLFYDGKLQKPVNCDYFRRNDGYLANVTSDDVRMCLNSAIQGSNIWQAYSTDTRIFLVTQLIKILKHNSKLLEDTDQLIKCWRSNEISLLHFETDKLEVIQHRIARGVIILKEKNEDILFRRLIQVLISGNSVIVLTDANSCNLVPYCHMFSLSKIPRGVINMLSHKDTRNLELILCATDYANYEKQFFTCSLEKTYMNLTLPKQILLSFK